RPLRPRIEIGPGQRTREGGMRLQSEPARGTGGKLQLLGGPGAAGHVIASHAGGSEAIEEGVICWMHGHQLALQVGGQLRDGQSMFREHAAYFVAVGLALGRAREVEQALVPRGNLHAAKAKRRSPRRDRRQAVERCEITRELREEEAGALERSHRLNTSSPAPWGRGSGRCTEVSIAKWQPSMEERSKASSTSSTCSANSPLARCGRPWRIAIAMSITPTAR